MDNEHYNVANNDKKPRERHPRTAHRRVKQVGKDVSSVCSRALIPRGADRVTVEDTCDPSPVFDHVRVNPGELRVSAAVARGDDAREEPFAHQGTPGIPLKCTGVMHNSRASFRCLPDRRRSAPRRGLRITCPR